MHATLTALALMTVLACASPGPAPPPTTDVEGTGAPVAAAPGEAVAGGLPSPRPAVAVAPEAVPPPSFEPAPADASASVVAFLDALEADGRALATFTARVLYEVEDALLGETVLRRGELLYHVDPDTGARRFGILFTDRIVDRRRRESRRDYVFTDRWLVEVDHDAKLFVKRELVPPGRTFDPFRLGEGPIPLPIGQRRRDVLDRYVVSEIVPPADGPLARLDAAAVRGLRLVPRSSAEDVAHVDLFFDRATLLPVGVEVIETNGDRRTARLDDVRRDVALGDAELRRLAVEVPAGDWRVDVRRLEGAAE